MIYAGTWRNEISFVALLAIAIAAIGCDGIIHLAGKVSDQQGNPIEGAKLVIHQGTHKVGETITGGNGSFNFSRTASPWQSKIRVSVSREGFKSREIRLDSRESAPNLNGDTTGANALVITLYPDS